MTKLYQRIMCSFLAFLLCFMSVEVYAISVQNGMHYPIVTNAIEGWPQGEDIFSETAVMIEAETGTILYSKGMDEIRYPASITKILTALVALEHCNLEEEVVFTEDCLADQVWGSKNIGMKVGEILTMEQCLYVMLIESANDVATQIAVHTAGSVSAFCELMNQKAVELGCKNTHFSNASGMPNDDHYTTAHDMALIFQQAIKNEVFRTIISTKGYTLNPTNLNSEARHYSTHHAMLADWAPQYYEGCFGGKTGMTNAAKSTLVTGIEKNGMTLIIVSMRAEDGGRVCYDHKQLADYAFDNFKKMEVPGGCVVIPNMINISQLTIQETVNGNIKDYTYSYLENHVVGYGREEVIPTVEVTPLPTVTEELSVQNPENVDQGINENTNSQDQIEEQRNFYLKVLLGIFLAMFLLRVVLFLKRRHKAKQRRLKKMNK